MGRSLALLLRLSVIASAVAVLFLSVRAVHAQDFTPVPGSSAPAAAATLPAPASDSVYGYNPGQGAPHVDTPPVALAPPPQIQAPYAPVPQAAYGYAAQPAPQATYGYASAYAPQVPYGYNPSTYGAPPPQRTAMTQQIPPPPVVQQQAQQQQRYGYATDRAYAPTNYGTQYSADPNAYYQDPNMGGSRSIPGYQLGAGDKIRVTVFGEADLSGEYQVDGSGVVRLPLIGTVRAVGYTAPGLEAWITSALAQGYLKKPRVNVEITTYRPFYIVGAVNRPGEYPYVENMSAMNAVALAGGFNDSAKQSTVYVRHEGSTVEEAVPTDEITHIRPGDVVRVKPTLFWDAMQIFQPLAPAALAVAAIRP